MDDRDPNARGSSVECAACGRTKAPRGRSVPMYVAGYCDGSCPGYACQPLPGDLWPGESRAEFGYQCSTAAELAGVGPVYVPATWRVERPYAADRIRGLASYTDAEDSRRRMVHVGDLRAVADYVEKLERALEQAARDYDTK